MSKRRVVITGMGALTPLGLDVATTWDALMHCKCGVRRFTGFDVSKFSVQIAACLQDYNPDNYFDVKESRKFDRFVQFAVVAASEAMQDAKLEVTEENAHRIGVLVGSGIGGLPLIEKNYSAYLNGGPRKIAPSFIPGAIINMASGLISIKYGLKGPSYAIVSACTTGTHNIGNAARMIAYGDADAVLAGGAEMASTVLGIGGFSAARALSRRNDDPEHACRPWDRDRDGFILGEGAGVLVLEEYEHAKKRGATIYAELAGFGMSSDAFHVTALDDSAEGPASSMRNALHDAGLNADQVDYINAHGTSTIANDPVEAFAIKKVFGDYAYKLAVSSTKSMTGHLLGSAGAVEAIISVLAIKNNVAPPTINLDNPDVGCDLDFVPHVPRGMKIDVALSNSFGFGGTNGTLILKRI